MSTREINLPLDGEDHLTSARVWARQSNPLKINATLAAGFTVFASANNVLAEILTASAPGGATPLAAVQGVAAGSGYTFTWTTAEMALDLGDDDSRVFWLVITARDLSGAVLQTLYRGRIEFRANAYSGAPVPAPALTLYATGSLVLHEGYATLTLNGVTANIPTVIP